MLQTSLRAADDQTFQYAIHKKSAVEISQQIGTTWNHPHSGRPPGTEPHMVGILASNAYEISRGPLEELW